MEPDTFDHIPTLPELLNGAWGIAGLTYAQVCVHNSTRAQRESDFKAVPRRPFYDIEGPKGTATMVLMYRGQPLTGAAGSRSECLADPDILTLTGHNPNPKILTEEKPGAEVKIPPTVGSQGRKDDARVQGGKPA